MATNYNLHGYRSGRLRALAAMALLGAGAVVDLLSALLNGFQAGGVLGGPDAAGSGEETLSLVDALHGLVFLCNFVVYVATVVAFLLWLHRAYSNLRPLGAPRTEFSPGWAVGYFFVPFLNLVRPYQAVREVWRWSKPASDTSEIDGLSCTADTGAALVGLWWGFWIVSNIASNIYYRLSDNIEAAGAVPWLGLFADLTSIAAAACAILMIRTIDRRQEERSKQLALSGVTFDQPPPPPTFKSSSLNLS